MAKSQLLRYDVYIPDKDLVDTLNAEIEAGGGTNINAYAAAAGLSTSVIVVNPFGPDNAYFYFDPLTAAQVSAFTALNGGVQLGAVLPSDPVIADTPAILVSSWFTTQSNFPWDERTFSVCTGGWFGICGLFGDNTTYYWGARFVYHPPAGENPETGTTYTSTPAPIPARRWFDSFSMIQQGESPNAQNGPWTRDATLWPGHNSGLGITRIVNADHRVHTLTENSGGGTSTIDKSWERLYFRIRSLPASEIEIWETSHTVSATEGCEIRLLPGGQLSVYTVSNVGVKTLVGTTTVAFAENQWVLLDLLYEVDAERLRIYSSHVEIFDAAVGGNWVAGHKHQQSMIRTEPSNDNELDIQFALWMNAEIPNKSGVESLDSADFIRGTRPVLLRATGFAADHGNWSGGFGISMQNYDPAEFDTAAESDSTTASDVYSITLDTDSELFPAGSLGLVSLNIARYGHRGAGQGELGYNLDAAGDVYAALTTEAAGPNKAWVGIHVDLLDPSATEPIQTVTSLEIKYRKAADTTAGTIAGLLAVAEVIGIFDAVDVHPDATTEPPPDLVLPVHNSAYPWSPWGARQSEPVVGPYGLFAGTYVGTGAEFELEFPLPVCFLHIRRVTGVGDPNFYWSTAHLAAHDGIEAGVRPDAIKAVRLDPAHAAAVADDAELSAIARISADAEINALGVTYQYFAIGDPAGRFHLLEALSGTASMTARAHALQHATFTALAAMLFGDSMNTLSTTTAWMVGGNLAAGAAVDMTGSAEIASGLTFGAGEVTVGNGIWSSVSDQIAAMLVRQDDGNGPFTVPPVRVVGWTGDGGASRTISLDLGGKRPLMAWAAGGAAGDGYYRDPSMTTTNSMDPDGGSHQANGITGGGVDQVSVGLDLNASGINYVMIVWPGSETAGNGGWSINGDFYPVEPDSIGDGIGTPTFSGGTSGGGGGAADPEEPDLDQVTALPDTDLFCEDFTRRLCNIALQRIGVNKRMTDLVADTSEEAATAREFIKYEVEACLRDYEWNFATAYADLTLVAGTASVKAVPDFQYSYREPVDSLMVRRIVGQQDQRRGFDPNPIRFRRNEQEGSTGGGLIYTDAVSETDTPVQIEYTRRVSCPAYFGDALFKDALIWRFAHAFAPPLTRDQRKVDYCWRQYLLALSVAETGAGNEEQEHRTSLEDSDWIRGRNS